MLHNLMRWVTAGFALVAVLSSIFLLLNDTFPQLLSVEHAPSSAAPLYSSGQRIFRCSRWSGLGLRNSSNDFCLDSHSFCGESFSFCLPVEQRQFCDRTLCDRPISHHKDPS